MEICLEHNENHYTSALQTSKFVKISDNVSTLSNNFMVKKRYQENIAIRTKDPQIVSIEYGKNNNELLNPASNNI